MANDNHADFSTYELGREHSAIEVDTSAAVSAACNALFSGATQDIVIMSRDLDPKVFDNAATSLALRTFLLRSRHVRLRILVKDAESVARRGHRIVELTQRLSSFAEIRVPAPEYKSHNTAFVVVDATGMVYRGQANRYEASVTFGDRNLARETVRQFDEMWQTSLSPVSLRRMSL
jgi:hypothetical protein